MKTRKEDSCKVCTFWKRIEDSHGHCWRYPPQPDGKAAAVDKPGQTLPDDWCGEFERIRKHPQPAARRKK